MLKTAHTHNIPIAMYCDDTTLQIPGVRFLDMDVSYVFADKGDYWKNGIVLVHQYAFSQPLRKALEEINDWLSCSNHLFQNLFIKAILNFIKIVLKLIQIP